MSVGWWVPCGDVVLTNRPHYGPVNGGLVSGGLLKTWSLAASSLCVLGVILNSVFVVDCVSNESSILNGLSECGLLSE